MKIFGIFATLAAAKKLDIITPEDVDNAKAVTRTVKQLVEKFEGEDYEFPCLRQFYEGCFRCVDKIQLGSQFCQEEHPNYNPVACAIQLNLCLIEELDGILQCEQQHPTKTPETN